MAAEPIVLHLPDDSHAMLVSVNQPHSHASHHHDDHEDAHDANVISDASEATADPAVNIEAHDDAAHEHAKHIHGHADVPAQLFVIASAPAGNECYLHKSQLTGITHTPPVPPPNA